MATDAKKVLDHLHRMFPVPTDGQLLARFVASRSEADFAALVRRHGAMVLGVCRRVLRHEQDAEDAFQATFLVLATKASAVLQRESVGSWLHGVAYRTARRARDARASRRSRERQVEDVPHPEVAPAEPQDWRPLLDEELSRLPQKYRSAIVLCDLQGQSRREAAAQLGVPEGTLSSRLAAARRALAQRLARRGVALAGSALAIAPSVASAQVPADLVSSTVLSATTAGQLAAVAAPATVLTRGGTQTMLMGKLKIAVGAVLLAAVFGAGGLAYHSGPAPAEAQVPQKDRKAENELEALRKENALLKLNLQAVLEKLRAQEEKLRKLTAEQGKGPKEKKGAPSSPVVARLVAKRALYVLDRGGKTGKELREQLQQERAAGERSPAPKVDLALELHNTSDKDVLIWIGGDGAILFLDLKGPGAVEINHNPFGLHTSDVRKPRTVPLAAGTSFTVPIRSLVYGFRGDKRAYWTEPGTYELVARYRTAICPPPPGSEKEDIDSNFGGVWLSTAPIKLKVTLK
jgi:RNA polymerase sigma factor (sigma-70 family)